MRRSKISGAVDFVGNIVFSTAVIFLCSFGIIGVFRFLSNNDVSDISSMAGQNPDAIVSTITGISMDENSTGGKLSNGVQEIVSRFENKTDYGFQDAVSDAGDLISGTFGDLDITAAIGNFMDSASDLIRGS